MYIYTEMENIHMKNSVALSFMKMYTSSMYGTLQCFQYLGREVLCGIG